MLLLRGGTVFDAPPDGPLAAMPPAGVPGGHRADVLIEDGSVRRVAAELAPSDHPGARVIDVSGCWVARGFVDLRAHLREPGEEHKETLETGRAAAAAGGFTAVCAMPGTTPVNDQRAVTSLIVDLAGRSPGPRIWPFGAITKGLRGQELSDMAELAEAGCVGVTDDRHPVHSAALLRRALEYASTFGLLLMQHCEEPALAEGPYHESPLSTRLGLRGQPREAEDVAVARDIRLAELAGASLHVAHVSSAGSVALLREAKARGLPVSADVSPHHLTMTEDALLGGARVGYDPRAKVLPPLREARDRDSLVEGLADGTLDCVASDHAPHTRLDKDAELDAAAFGLSSLETTVSQVLSLVRDGRLSAARAVQALGAAPARVLGKPTGLLGQGDVTVVDPARRWTPTEESLRSKGKNTPLLGCELEGAARLTIVGGEVVFEAKAR
ncbi:MAG: dihydroorotase [Myxococcota bacterium]